mgnify:CR=1 FL=1
MNFEATIGTLIVALLLLIVAFFKSRQPKDIDSPWSIPWHGVIFISILVTLLMINHLFSLNSDGLIPAL